MGETVVPRGLARAQQRPEAVEPAAVVLRVGCAETRGPEHEAASVVALRPVVPTREVPLGPD